MCYGCKKGCKKGTNNMDAKIMIEMYKFDQFTEEPNYFIYFLMVQCLYVLFLKQGMGCTSL